METLEAYDLGTLYFFGSLHRPWLDPIVRSFSLLGNFFVLGPLAVLMTVILFVIGQRKYAIGFALIALGAEAVERSAKYIVNRPRPQVVWRLIDLPQEPSFPSGHALTSMAIYTAAGVLVGRLSQKRSVRIASVVAGVALGLMIGLTRPYLGVHYPKDVLAGWIAGLGCVLIGLSFMGPPETLALPPRSDTNFAPPSV